MEEFKTYKISELLREISMGPFGSNIKVENFIKDGVPVLNGANLQGFKLKEYSFNYVSEEKADSLGKANAYRGDIVITHRGTLGQIIYIPIDSKYNRYVISQSQFRLTLNTNIVRPDYFVYYFHTRIGQHKIMVNASQVGVPALARPTSTFRDVTIDLPPLETQNKIMDILLSIDSKIELNHRINENLEQQAQALFKSWFIDFEPFKDGKFVDSELGMIPEGWRVGYYTELVDIKGGGTPKTNIKEFWNGSIPFFSPKDIGPSCFVLNTEKYITTNGLENCNSNLFPPYSVFITARGTVGKVVMVGSEMAMNQSNYALLGKQNISQFYVYLITLQLVSHLLKKANGAVFNAITTRDFASERIIIPFYSIIKSFSSIVKPIYENILLNEFQIKSLSQLRDTLLPRLMSGELEIKDNSYD